MTTDRPYLGLRGDARCYLDTGELEGVVPERHLWPALARTYRWSAQVDWTVLQHSVLVALILTEPSDDNSSLYDPDVDWGMVAMGAAHDVHEAIVTDVPWPIKQLLLAEHDFCLDNLERAVQDQVFDLLGVYDLQTDERWTKVHAADRQAAAEEAAYFGLEYPNGPTPRYQWLVRELSQWSDAMLVASIEEHLTMGRYHDAE